MNRHKAFLLHLSASMLVGGLTALWVFGVWYPSPLHQAVGATAIFLLLLGVDIAIGPFLTLVVYSPTKSRRHLGLDLAAIVLCQLVALSYGLWTVAKGRPVWVVFNADRFDVVQAYQIEERYRLKAKPEYRQTPWWGPRWVGATRPEGRDERNALLFEALLEGVDLPQRPDLYCPLVEVADAMRNRSRNLDELRQYNPPDRVHTLTNDWPEADAWLPLMASDHSMTVLIDRETTRVIAIVDLQPWM